MFEPQVIRADHKDEIHDVVYDYYGQRMATCSSDQTVKVWDQKDNGIWSVTASWKAHSGSVWRLSWAHPEFGQVLATCSFDRTVSVWEEVLGEKPAGGTAGGNQNPNANPNANVNPNSAGSGGGAGGGLGGVGSISSGGSSSANPSYHQGSTANLNPSGSTTNKRWVRRTNLVDSRTSVTDVQFGPKGQGLLLATSSVDGIIRIYEAPDIMNLSQWTLAYDIACKLPLSCISWNQSLYRLHAPMIAAGSDDASQLPGSSGKVFVFEYSVGGSGKWQRTETLALVTEPVHDISFAPNVGRSYHILAVASKDVQIFNLRPLGDSNGSQRFDVQMVARFSDHNCTVWRTSWNVTGTMLASTGDDGYVRMWKMNYLKSWKCAAVLKPDGTAHDERDEVIGQGGGIGGGAAGGLGGGGGVGAMQTGGQQQRPFGGFVVGSTTSDATGMGGAGGNGGNGSNANNTTKYYKRGIISHPNQVPWH